MNDPRDFDENWADRAKGVIFVVALMIFLLFALSYCTTSRASGLPEGLTGEMQSTPMICGDTAVLYDALKKDHGEDPMVLGFNRNYGAVVWFSNPERTKLSIVIDTPVRSCLIYSAQCLPGDCFVPAPELIEDGESDLDKLKNLGVQM